MNIEQVLQVIAAISALIQEIAKLLESLKALGVDVSGVKLATSQPLDLVQLVSALAKKP